MLKAIKGLFTKDKLVVVNKSKRAAARGRPSLSKKQRVLNLLQRGGRVAWETLRNKFDLESPRAMIDTLRAEGNMIYGSKSAGKTYYRIGTPTRAIVAAGINALYGTKFRYNNWKSPVRKAELAPIN